MSSRAFFKLLFPCYSSLLLSIHPKQRGQFQNKPQARPDIINMLRGVIKMGSLGIVLSLNVGIILKTTVLFCHTLVDIVLNRSKLQSHIVIYIRYIESASLAILCRNEYVVKCSVLEFEAQMIDEYMGVLSLSLSTENEITRTGYINIISQGSF